VRRHEATIPEIGERGIPLRGELQLLREIALV
jgi:hypothetical protein